MIDGEYLGEKPPVVERSRNPQQKFPHLSYNQNHPLHPHTPAMRHWQPEQQLQNGKYIIEAILGGGGFGVTYRAQNPKEGKTVAIKTLNANGKDSGQKKFRDTKKYGNVVESAKNQSQQHYK